MNQPEPSQRKNLIWIPLGFSAAYHVGSCAVGFYGGSGSWPALSRGIAASVARLLVALASILLLWLS
jgi:hypothetical protein